MKSPTDQPMRPNSTSKNGSRFGALHPLSGADPETLFTLPSRYGDPCPEQWGRFAAAALFSLLRAPASAADWVRSQWLLRAERPDPQPLFILGHWRSGTTHLYNLINEAPRFGCVSPLATGLPWDLLGIAQWFRKGLEKTLPKERLIDRIPVTPTSPQEDEIAIANMQTISFYHALYFPRRFQRNFDRGVYLEGLRPEELAQWERRFRYFVQRLSLALPGREIVLKNPAHTGRPATLRRLFPRSKFVFLSRDPFRVFLSMRNFYAKLLPELALQDYSALDIDEIILNGMEGMDQRLREQTVGWPKSQWLTLDYEGLNRDPLGVLQQIYHAFGYEDFERDRPRFERYLASIQDYETNRYPSVETLTPRIQERLKALAATPINTGV